MKMLLVYFLMHFIGRAFFRIWKNQEKKSVMAIVYPSLIYFALMFVPYLVLGFQLSMLITAIALGLTHFVVVFACFYLSCQPDIADSDKSMRILDLVGRLLSLALILLVVVLFRSGYVYNKNGVGTFLLVDHVTWLKFIASIVLMVTPGNFIIKMLLGEKKQPVEGERKNGGALLGSFERVILLAGFFYGLYAPAILVIVAKAIMGPGVFHKDLPNAERYAIGTLASIIYAVLVTGLCFGLTR